LLIILAILLHTNNARLPIPCAFACRRLETNKAGKKQRNRSDFRLQNGRAGFNVKE